MSDEQVRVGCPACGQRFRVDPAAVPEGPEGNPARCRKCQASFRVRHLDGELVATLLESSPAPEAEAKPAKKGKTPVSKSQRRKQKADPGGKSSRQPAKKPAKPPPAPPPAWLAQSPFGLGDRVGRYEIEGELARGGMGSIYKAYDPAANRHVALKVLLSSATDLDRLRFQREIQVQGNIQHPHIMPIFDSGVIGQTRYFTMELLKDPVDLIALCEKVHNGEAAKDPKLRPVSTEEGVIRRIVMPICEAIYQANVNEGVLHRDFKPGNVLLDRNGLRSFVIDFGVSHLLEKKNTRLAHLDKELPVPLGGEGVSITGTLVFMPPEQARGQADRRGDVWALGALLHYIVTNEPPLEAAIRPTVSPAERIAGLKMLIEEARKDGKFSEAAEFEDKLAALKAGRERSVKDLRADVLRGHYMKRPPGTDRALDAIITKAMMPNPELRYRHAMDLHDDLDAWLEGRPVRALVKTAGRAGGALYRGRLQLKRHKVLVALSILLVAAVFLGLKYWPPAKGAEDGLVVAKAHMEKAWLLEKTADHAGARQAAYAAQRAVPGHGEAQALLERIESIEKHARARGRARVLQGEALAAFDAGDLVLARRKQAALEEVLTQQWMPLIAAEESGARVDKGEAEAQELLRFARGQQRLEVGGAPAGCRFSLIPVQPGGGRIAWKQAAPLELDATGAGLAKAGSWILRLQREKGEVLLPIVIEPGTLDTQVDCPIDPALVDATRVYVGAGQSVGPRGGKAVRALFFDRAEVSVARYAAFLKSLPPEEQRRRMPRLAGSLGALGDPLWERSGSTFVVPAGALRKPVEGVSLYDAQALARFEKKRLPTAAEWAFAASGTDGRLSAAGHLSDLLSASVHIDRPLAGVADGLSAPLDRSPFGVYDLAGNLAEFTGTLGTLRGETGWFVMGASYLSTASDALVNEARVVAGWMPLQGVGIRLVSEAP